jgi:hypothetical protein
MSRTTARYGASCFLGLTLLVPEAAADGEPGALAPDDKSSVERGEDEPRDADPVRDIGEGARGRSDKEGPKPYPLELAASFGVFSRSFEYHQDVNQNLRPYHLPRGPTSALGVRWYPGAHFTEDVPAHIGIVGDYERSIGTSSKTEDGELYGTTMQQFSVGSRWRALGRHQEFGVSFVYGQHSYTIDGDGVSDGTAANGLSVERDHVPDVSYSYLRPGFDARIAIGLVHLGGALGYRSVLSTGDLETDPWFPRATAAGLDLSLSAGIQVIDDLVISAAVDMRRYAIDMHAEAADLAEPRDVAGGAVDQYLAGRLGVLWRLPGDGSAPGQRRWNFAGAE